MVASLGLPIRGKRNPRGKRTTGRKGGFEDVGPSRGLPIARGRDDH